MTTFDPARARRVCEFFERVLRHPKERFAPFLLTEWERRYLRRIFGTIDERGLRTIRRSYLEIPKKNGKSELAAGIALYMLSADDEPAAEIYGAATTKDQAGIVFRTAAAMVQASPFLRRQLRVIRSTKTIVKRDDPDSFYRAISADGDAQDGINPHCVIVDELHRWKTARHFELLDVLTKGTVARAQPLVCQITTAGSTEEDSPLAWREHQYVQGIEAGDFTDTHFYGKIYAAGPDDDWQSAETWAKANPSLETHRNGFLKIEALASEAEKAKNQPARKNAFLRYHLGIWSASDAEWMPPTTWNKNAVARKPVVDRPCYLGLDLSSKIDLTSLVCVFPDVVSPDEVHYDVLPFFWMAAERVKEREEADRVPYSEWVRQGFIEETQGNVIDLRDIKRKIKWCTEMFQVRELGYDPNHADQLATELDEEGVKCVPIPQVFKHLSEPTKLVMELALHGRFRHEGNPVLSWNARCTRVKDDGNDNIKPVKPNRRTSGKRIDGMVALILAIARARFADGGSVYEERGVVLV